MQGTASSNETLNKREYYLFFLMSDIKKKPDVKKKNSTGLYPLHKDAAQPVCHRQIINI